MTWLHENVRSTDIIEDIQAWADAYHEMTGVGGPVSVLVGDGDSTRMVPLHEAQWIVRLIFHMAGPA